MATLPAAFESAERMRVHDLRVFCCCAASATSHRGMTDAEREEERTLAGELVSLHAQLSRERGLPKPDAARIARLEKAAAEATEKKTAQQQALFRTLPALAHVAWTDGASHARRCRTTAARRRGHRRSTRRHRRFAPGIVRDVAAMTAFDSRPSSSRRRGGAIAGRVDQAPATRDPARSGGMAKSDA